MNAWLFLYGSIRVKNFEKTDQGWNVKQACPKWSILSQNERNWVRMKPDGIKSSKRTVKVYESRLWHRLWLKTIRLKKGSRYRRRIHLKIKGLNSSTLGQPLKRTHGRLAQYHSCMDYNNLVLDQSAMHLHWQFYHYSCITTFVDKNRNIFQRDMLASYIRLIDPVVMQEKAGFKMRIEFHTLEGHKLEYCRFIS